MGRKYFECPKCKREMHHIEQKRGEGVVKCRKCHWAIYVSHWMIAGLIKEE